MKNVRSNRPVRQTLRFRQPVSDNYRSNGQQTRLQANFRGGIMRITLTFHMGHVVQAFGLFMIAAGGFLMYEAIKQAWDVYQTLSAM
jgi:hypothetical protein